GTPDARPAGVVERSMVDLRSRGGFGMFVTTDHARAEFNTVLGSVLDLVRAFLPRHERPGLEAGPDLPDGQPRPFLARPGEQLVQRAVVESGGRGVVRSEERRGGQECGCGWL